MSDQISTELNPILELLSFEEKKVIAEAAQTYNTFEELQAAFGEDGIWDIASQTAQEIADFINDPKHLGEMLPKTSEDIFNNIKNGHSVVIVGDLDGKKVLLSHSATYPLLEEEAAKDIGMQVIEFGSNITNRHFRNGLGLGTHSVQARIDKVKEIYGDNFVGIVTIKQHPTFKTWAKAVGENLSVLNWNKYPFLSALTDSCANVNPREHESGYCPLRAPITEFENGITDRLRKETGLGKLPCLMLCIDEAKALEFEVKMMRLLNQVERDEIQSVLGKVEALSKNIFSIIDKLFANLNSEA